MKCVIFYFSGTGNTKWIVKNTTKLLTEKGYDAVNYSLEKFDDNHPEIVAAAVQNCDYIGFAYPIYGANVPRIMREFFEEFIKLSKVYDNSNTKLLFINTFGYVNGHGYFRLKKLFKNCHLPIMGYFNFRLTNNTKKRTGKEPLLGNLIPASIKKKGYNKIRSLIYAMEHGRKVINGIGPHLIVSGIIKNILDPIIRDNYTKMAVDYEACIKCMQCVEKCPVQGIEYIDDKFVFNDNCETCCRCYNICPSKAIILRSKSKNI